MDAARDLASRARKNVRGRLPWGALLRSVAALIVAAALAGVAAPNLIDRHDDLALAGAVVAYIAALGLVIYAGRRIVRSLFGALRNRTR